MYVSYNWPNDWTKLADIYKDIYMSEGLNIDNTIIIWGKKSNNDKMPIMIIILTILIMLIMIIMIIMIIIPTMLLMLIMMIINNDNNYL